MASTPRAGRNSRILIDVTTTASGTVSKITAKNKWTLDQKIDTFEVTEFEAANKTYVAGLPDAQGTVEGFWDSADNNIYNVIGSSVPRALYIYPDAVNNSGSYWFTTAYFSVKPDSDVKGPVGFSLTYVAASVASWVHP